MMPPKYSREQREAVYELFMMGRADGKRERGRYTLKDIERLTGVKAGSAWAIARGVR